MKGAQDRERWKRKVQEPVRRQNNLYSNCLILIQTLGMIRFRTHVINVNQLELHCKTG